MDKITFKTRVPGVEEVAPPVPAAQMIPDWFRNLQMDIPIPDKKPFPVIGNIIKNFNNHTIKKCPAVVDYLAEGYIIPLWADLLIQRHEQEFYWETNIAEDLPNAIEFHPEEQFKGYPFKRNDFKTAVKFTSPWHFYTPKGWSTLFIQPLLHPNNDFTLIPGIVETDSFHQVNFPSIWHSEGDRILKRGMPFLHVIPFKRSKTKLNIEVMKNEDHYMNRREQFLLKSKMTGGYRLITLKNRK